MNNRIKKLAEQAGMIIVDDEFSTYGKFAEKFAELIVKECADISDASFHNGSAGYLAILKHFGVED
jgi:hypothetical protein